MHTSKEIENRRKKEKEFVKSYNLEDVVEERQLKPVPRQGFDMFCSTYCYAVHTFRLLYKKFQSAVDLYKRLSRSPREWALFKILIKLIHILGLSVENAGKGAWDLLEGVDLYTKFIASEGNHLRLLLNQLTMEVYFKFGYCPSYEVLELLHLEDEAMKILQDLLHVPLREDPFESLTFDEVLARYYNEKSKIIPEIEKK